MTQHALNFPSQKAANDMLRVLNGKPKKYTVSVHLPDGRNVEFQSEEGVTISYLHETRSTWLVASKYPQTPIMEWPTGAIMLVEENPPEVKE